MKVPKGFSSQAELHSLSVNELIHNRVTLMVEKLMWSIKEILAKAFELGFQADNTSI